MFCHTTKGSTVRRFIRYREQPRLRFPWFLARWLAKLPADGWEGTSRELWDAMTAVTRPFDLIPAPNALVNALDEHAATVAAAGFALAALPVFGSSRSSCRTLNLSGARRRLCKPRNVAYCRMSAPVARCTDLRNVLPDTSLWPPPSPGSHATRVPAFCRSVRHFPPAQDHRPHRPPDRVDCRVARPNTAVNSHSARVYFNPRTDIGAVGTRRIGQRPRPTQLPAFPPW